MSPSVGQRMPVSILIVVLLPAPFGPMNPTTSPGSMLNDTSWTAWTSSYCGETSDLMLFHTPSFFFFVWNTLLRC